MTDYINNGLSDAEVKERTAQGLDNKVKKTSRSAARILADNACTLFNLINLILAVALLSVGSYKNTTSFLIVLANLLIGLIQELRAKRAVDKLSVLSASSAEVIRNGQSVKIPYGKIVHGDLLVLNQGQQIPVDCIILSGSITVDESCITGESDGITKQVNDEIHSGSFVLGGICRAQAVSVGKDTYVSVLSAQASRHKRVSSEIMRTLNKIIRILSVAVLAMGVLLFISQFNVAESLTKAITGTAAALLGMIPNGLMLLTSSVMAVAVVRLSRYKVLVQGLYSIENLARVDVLCLDKTGTLTKGNMQVEKYIALQDEAEAVAAAKQLNFALPQSNATADALVAYFGREQTTVKEIFAFTSKTKWAGASFEGGTYVWGAPEYLMPQMPEALSRQADELAQSYRVLLLAKCNGFVVPEHLPELTPLMFIMIKDTVRPDAEETLQYFAQQGVDAYVLSGDNPKTVSRVAADCGYKNTYCVDASKLAQEDYITALREHRLFGRVSPMQKQEFVRLLKKEGHSVAMTGDGVNDVPAMREADCSIAMGSGTDAAKGIAQLVLLDSRFASLPGVVAEGRRDINNLQRSSALFLVKTVYACLLSLLFVFNGKSYPFEPIQNSLLSVAGIGVPSFLLALEPNKERIHGSFFANILQRCLPGGLTVFTVITLLQFLQDSLGLSSPVLSTFCLLLAAEVFMLNLYCVSKPLNLFRGGLWVAMLALFAVGVGVFPAFFEVHLPDAEKLPMLLVAVAITAVLFTLLYVVINRVASKHTKKQ